MPGRRDDCRGALFLEVAERDQHLTDGRRLALAAWDASDGARPDVAAAAVDLRLVLASVDVAEKSVDQEQGVRERRASHRQWERQVARAGELDAPAPYTQDAARSEEQSSVALAAAAQPALAAQAVLLECRRRLVEAPARKKAALTLVLGYALAAAVRLASPSMESA